MKNKSVPELLAPAGSMDSLKAAVNAGADAVYLAGQSFGARHYAKNFGKVEIEEAVEYAHLRGSKVYITVNTLIKDLELEKIAEYLLWLYQIGLDAVIIQDVGVASLCRNLVPKLDMHASTQMTINTLEEVEWAHEFGFKRVILSREMKLSDVEEIIHNLRKQVELEIFVHGALCYCYSGQCLLSSFIGGRSGNRGRCAQPCRKPYELLNGKKDKYGKPFDLVPLPLKENFILSTRDLSLYNNLDTILDSGVNSLKIEGRMRSPEYVATVVSIYRKALNDLSNGKWTPDLKEDYNLKLAFNRNFTKGHLLETNRDFVMGRETPGNRGLLLGVVSDYNYKNKSALINLKIPFKLEKGDGVVFIHPNSEREYGMIIEQAPQCIDENHTILLNTKKLVSIGSKVYITRDISLIKTAQNIIKSDYTNSIPIDIHIRWDKENKLIIDGEFSGSNGNKHEIHFKSDFKMELAIKNPLSKEQIVNQVKKTGGTPFNVRRIELDYPGDLFTPLSKLNSIRREFINKAEIKLLNDFKPQKNDVASAEERLRVLKQELKTDNKKSSKETLLSNSIIEAQTSIAAYTSSLETIKGALAGGCRHIYFEPFLGEQYHCESPCEVMDTETCQEKIFELILKAKDLCTVKKANLVWKWPSIINPSYIKNITPTMNSLFREDVNEILVGSYGVGWAITNLNPHIKLYSSAGSNVWNYFTVKELSHIFHSLTISNELSKEEISSIIINTRNNELKTSFELIVQGNLESIISKDCLLSNISRQNEAQFWGIKDAKKRVFPIVIDNESRTHILNSVELCLIDYLPYLNNLGFKNVIIDARGKTKDYTKNMITYYKTGFKYLKMNPSDLNYNLIKLKNKIKKISYGGITTGNFIRGLNEDLKYSNSKN